ncbi:unnamed protein product [Rodentolepis nana]|uniref:Rab-GAP TBC domain-containing protein n=1 Tax=Rodentolepis nana TaxID=102285 RepID=A0A0R3TV23_RODNA|nr:unnamed protein product [Rodentolepis nana]
MLEGDGRCTYESGDLSYSQDDVILKSPGSQSLQRYVSAPEFDFRKATSAHLGPNPVLIDSGLNLSPSTSVNSFFPSTTFLHAYDRPSELPKKDPHEARRHQVECDKIMQNITKKHRENLVRIRAEHEKRNADAEKAENRLNYWRDEVIPNWDTALQSKTLHTDWWYGIPSSLRCQVWHMIIGNPLGITRELFEGCLSQSQHTIRRLDRERLLNEGYDLSPPSSHSPSSTKYATLPTLPLSRISRINSLPNERDGEDESSGNGEIDNSILSPRSRPLLRQVSFNFTGVETPTIPRKVLTAPPTPLSPPPSLSISGDLSSS